MEGEDMGTSGAWRELMRCAVARGELLVAGQKSCRRMLITEDGCQRLLRVLLLIIGEDFESSEDFKVLFVIGDDH